MDDSLSIFSLIIGAGFVVQVVMLILVLMSVYSWTIALSKKKQLINASKDVNSLSDKFIKNININLKENYKKLPTANTQRSPIQRIFALGYEEFTHSKATSTDAVILNSERAYRTMNTATNIEIDRLDKDLSILAMIASSSPYIGLFGTVWGIMHSFIGLASVKQATIAIVAPGIAEALIATAFGLFAAIPATIFYNRLISQVEVINNKYSAFIEHLFVLFHKQ